MALTTVQNLEQTLDIGLNLVERNHASHLIDIASATITTAAGTAIAETTSTFTVEGKAQCRLVLPVSPVTAVATVTLDGTTITDWVLRGDSLWRDHGWQRLWRRSSEVEITATHGYATVPLPVRVLCEQMVALALSHKATETLGPEPNLRRERIGDYEYELSDDGERMHVFDLPAATRRWLRSTYGGGHVTVDQA